MEYEELKIKIKEVEDAIKKLEEDRNRKIIAINEEFEKKRTELYSIWVPLAREENRLKKSK